MKILEIVPNVDSRRNALFALADAIDSWRHPTMQQVTYETRGFTFLGMFTWQAPEPGMQVSCQVVG